MTTGYKASALARLGDWVVSVFSPRRAWMRGHFRRMDTDPDYRHQVIDLLRMRGYRAAKTKPGQTGWLGTQGGPDQNTLNDLPALRGRSRELGCDDPVGSGLRLTFTTNVIGTGIVPQARTGDEDKNDRLEAVWNSRAPELHPADRFTYGEAQGCKFDRIFEDGGVLVKATRRDPDEPVWFEIIEADRLGNPVGAKAQVAGGSIVKGVEKDEWGVPVAYWISKRRAKPGVSAMSVSAPDYDRHEASECRYVKLRGRPGQTHGVPEMHAVMQDLRDLDLLMLAGLKRAQIAACLAVFIKSPMPVDGILDVTAQEYGYRLDQTIEPGMMWKLGPDEEISTLVPNFPFPDLIPFVVLLARRIGAALGVSWQIVLKDFSESNYSSARTDLLEARGRYVVLQRWFVEALLGWEWRTVLEDARLRGDARMAGVTDDDIAAVHWIPNGWRWVDPLKEAQGIEIELRLGITTLRDVCASQGRDWRETLQQRLAEERFWHEERARLELPPAPYMASKSEDAGAADAKDDDDPRPPAKAGRGLMALIGRDRDKGVG